MPEQAVSQSPAYRARPTIKIDGQTDDMLSDLLIGMELIEAEGGMSTVQLRLSNFASAPEGEAHLAFEDERVVSIGSSLEVLAGDETSPQALFRGVVTGVQSEFSQDAPPEMVVFAEDSLQGARLARRTRVHEDGTLADLASAIAGDMGLTPRISGFSNSIGLQVQWNESDLAFLRRVLARFDGDVHVIGDELHVAPRDEVSRGILELDVFGQLRSVRAFADLAHQVTEVTTSGWNPDQGARVSGTSTGSVLGPGRGRTGSDLLGSSIGARSEHVSGLAVSTDGEAQALADAVFDRRARGFVMLQGTTEGNAGLRVGTHVAVNGMSDRFDNTYYVVWACHRYDQQRGYETDFEAECAYLGAA